MTIASPLGAHPATTPLDASARFERLVHELKTLQRSMSPRRRVDAVNRNEHLLRDIGLTRDDLAHGGDLRVWVV